MFDGCFYNVGDNIPYVIESGWGGQFHQGGGQYMLGYIVRGGQYILGYIVRGTIYPRLYCPGGQYKGGQYILRHRYIS